MKFLTSLAIAMLLTGFAGSASAALISFESFSMETNGSAALVGSVLRLTPDTTSQAGSAYVTPPFSITGDTSLSSFFQFRIHGTQGSVGADGLAFVLQNSAAGADALGDSGGNLGYSGVTNSLAVEFDTFLNGDFGDPDNNHIGVNTNGSLNSIITSSAVPDLNSGNSLFAWVDYDGATNLLQVFVNTTSTKPAVPQISIPIDLPTLVGSQAFIGFSGATGGLRNIHDIEDWLLEIPASASVPQPAALALLGLGVAVVALARRLTARLR